jgi:hypothetical protein
MSGVRLAVRLGTVGLTLGLLLVAFVTLNVLFIRGIGRAAEQPPITDAAGMQTISLIVIDGLFLVFFAKAVGSRARRWLWLRFHA